MRASFRVWIPIRVSTVLYAGFLFGACSGEGGKESPPAHSEEARPPVCCSHAIQLLRSSSVVDRMTGHRWVLDELREGRLTSTDRGALIGALLELARVEEHPLPMESTSMLAIELLGMLEAREAVPLLMNKLLVQHPRPVVGDIDSWLSVAGAALARVGGPAIGPILDRASTADDEEWAMLRAVLRVITDQDAVRGLAQDRFARARDRVGRARLEPFLPRSRGEVAPGISGTAGALSGAQLQSVVAGNRARLQSCYEIAFRKRANPPSGRLDVGLTVSREGRATSVRTRIAGARNSDAEFEPVRACVEAAVRQWTFPPSASSVETTFPLVFKRTD